MSDVLHSQDALFSLATGLATEGKRVAGTPYGVLVIVYEYAAGGLAVCANTTLDRPGTVQLLRDVADSIEMTTASPPGVADDVN